MLQYCFSILDNTLPIQYTVSYIQTYTFFFFISRFQFVNYTKENKEWTTIPLKRDIRSARIRVSEALKTLPIKPKDTPFYSLKNSLHNNRLLEKKRPKRKQVSPIQDESQVEEEANEEVEEEAQKDETEIQVSCGLDKMELSDGMSLIAGGFVLHEAARMKGVY